MPSCVIRFCTNYTCKTSKSLGITYHSFPANELRRIQWVNIIREQRKEEGWQPNSSSKICSVHFKNDDKYTSKKGFTLLKKSALPVLQKPYSSQGAPASPNSLNEEEILDLESIFDTPREAALKKCVRKINFEKRQLINKNRNLIKKNKRLQKKVASMSTILKQLKKKAYLSDKQYNKLDLNTELINLFNRIISKKQAKKSFRQKYPAALRKFALTLNFYSSAAYKYVRRVFHTALPHPRVLGKWCENNSVTPGRCFAV